MHTLRIHGLGPKRRGERGALSVAEMVFLIAGSVVLVGIVLFAIKGWLLQEIPKTSTEQIQQQVENGPSGGSGGAK